MRRWVRRYLHRYKYTTAAVLIVGTLVVLAIVYGHGSWRKAAIAGGIAGGLVLVRDFMDRWMGRHG